MGVLIVMRLYQTLCISNIRHQRHIQTSYPCIMREIQVCIIQMSFWAIYAQPWYRSIPFLFKISTFSQWQVIFFSHKNQGNTWKWSFSIRENMSMVNFMVVSNIMALGRLLNSNMMIKLRVNTRMLIKSITMIYSVRIFIKNSIAKLLLLIYLLYKSFKGEMDLVLWHYIYQRYLISHVNSTTVRSVWNWRCSFFYLHW